MTVWQRQRWVALVFAAAFCLVVAFVPQQRSTIDGRIMQQVGVSLVEHGTPLVHPIMFGAPSDGYSNYGIGTSVVMGGLYKVGGDAGMALTNSVLYAATVAGIFVLLRRRGFSDGIVAVVTALFAVGTPLFAYALSDYSEPGTALMVVLGLIGLDAAEKGSRFGAVAVGAAVGGAVLFRTDSWVSIAPPLFAGLWLLSRRWRSIAVAFAGLAPFAAVWLAYNAARFGSPFSGGYNEPFSHPLLSGLYGLALSPGRGLFVYVPVLLVALAVIPSLPRNARIFGMVAAAILVLRLLFFARWWAWYGGVSWGPRFMVPVLPAFAPLVADAVKRWGRNPLLELTAGLSVAMGAIGFLVAIDVMPMTYDSAPMSFKSAMVWVTAPPQQRARLGMELSIRPEYVKRNDSLMFDWTRFP